MRWEGDMSLLQGLKGKKRRNRGSLVRRKARKLLLRVRVPRVCANCGMEGGKLRVHHKLPIADGGTNKLKNLVYCCNGCEDGIHGRF